MAEQALDRLRVIVFDTETTGLRPNRRDEIVSIAAVPLSDGNVEEHKAFSTLVNPGRKIPRRSTAIHGITDDMVRDAPGISSALRDFRSFIGDDVLVAHYAAFDLSFLRRKEKVAGVTFDNPVLDTMLLSLCLDRGERDHTLDGVAARAGVSIQGRHTALGDAVAAAEVYLALLPRLMDKGIDTLSRALSASQRVDDELQRMRQHSF